MLKIELSKAICSMVDSMFNQSYPKNKILLFEVHAQNFKDDRRGNMIIAFHRESNYTKVFELTQHHAIVDGQEFTFSPILNEKYAVSFKNKWRLEAYHDSDWRHGVDRLINALEEQIDPDNTMSNNDYVSFGINKPCFVNSEVRRVSSNHDNQRDYHIIIKGISYLKKELEELKKKNIEGNDMYSVGYNSAINTVMKKLGYPI